MLIEVVLNVITVMIIIMPVMATVVKGVMTLVIFFKGAYLCEL